MNSLMSHPLIIALGALLLLSKKKATPAAATPTGANPLPPKSSSSGGSAGSKGGSSGGGGGGGTQAPAAGQGFTLGSLLNDLGYTPTPIGIIATPSTGSTQLLSLDNSTLPDVPFAAAGGVLPNDPTSAPVDVTDLNDQSSYFDTSGPVAPDNPVDFLSSETSNVFLDDSGDDDDGDGP
jgi:hypothetical protein